MVIMSLTVFAVVLFAAVLHAAWNAIVKSGSDKLLTTILVASSAGGVAALILPFLPPPAAASWPFLLASMVFQIIYFVLVAGVYRAADMSQAYPLMRGTAPLLVSVASAALLHEYLSVIAWSGICLICVGTISLAWTVRANGNVRGAALALLNAVVIAAYTLIDGAGVRLSAAPIAYAAWLFLLTAIPLAGWAFVIKGAVFRRYAAKHLHIGMLGGLGSCASYGLALWAMTRVPVAVVAALRETSILFAIVIAAFVLKERVSRQRIAAVCGIAAGAAMLRLA
jgi:drug/metabolite transporter (DMT)-like permease